MTLSSEQIAGYIQHTLLAVTATRDDITRLCDECLTYNFQAAVVQPMWIPHAAQLLANSQVALCAVADFPHGAGSIASTRAEITWLRENGATEIDVVAKIGYLFSGMDDAFRDDLVAVKHAAQGAITKVILETSIVTGDRLARAIELAVDAGMDYIKTASGFNGPGATVEIVETMHRLARGRVKVKAAGGIRSYEDACAMIAAGAESLGTSSGVAIMTGAQTAAGAY